MYEFSRRLCWLCARTIFRLRTVGSEHIPNEGAVILCSNHRSLWDPPLIGCALKRQVHYMAKEELLRIPVLRSLLRSFGVIPVARGQFGLDMMKKVLRFLKDGSMIAIFPEGTRNRTGTVTQGKKGAASIALRSGATVIPVAICGTYRWFRPMTIVYGKPFVWEAPLSADASMPAGDVYEQWTEALMAEIERLLASGENVRL